MASNRCQFSTLIPEKQAKSLKVASLVKHDQQADDWKLEVVRQLSSIRDSIEAYLNGLFPDSKIEAIELEACDLASVNEWSSDEEAYLLSYPLINRSIHAWVKKSEIFALSSISLGGPWEIPTAIAPMSRIEHKVAEGLMRSITQAVTGLLPDFVNNVSSVVDSESNRFKILEDRLFFSDFISIQAVVIQDEQLLEFYVLIPTDLNFESNEQSVESIPLYLPEQEDTITLDASVTMANVRCTYQQLQRWTKGDLLHFDFLEKMPLSIHGKDTSSNVSGSLLSNHNRQVGEKREASGDQSRPHDSGTIYVSPTNHQHSTICGYGAVTEEKGQLVFKFEN